MALTGKKRLFADAVIAGKSNRDAAIAAGYSAKTASAAGSRLVKDPKVVEYLKDRRKDGRKGPLAAASPAPKPPPSFDLGAALAHSDPKTFLMAAMNDLELDPRQRIDAAKALMPFVHQKLGEGGKKDQQNEAAKKVASRFSPAAPPRLAAAGGRKV
ncbi:terminase small subunit [Cupriavidus sp. 2MCAB6]|uniref:terminase small subunit n=1 Tax=Cupriavidus sp. 2MCAB6 TaxID=3232981 RepID=UPI003F905A53